LNKIFKIVLVLLSIAASPVLITWGRIEQLPAVIAGMILGCGSILLLVSVLFDGIHIKSIKVGDLSKEDIDRLQENLDRNEIKRKEDV